MFFCSCVPVVAVEERVEHGEAHDDPRQVGERAAGVEGEGEEEGEALAVPKQHTRAAPWSTRAGRTPPLQEV